MHKQRPQYKRQKTSAFDSIGPFDIEPGINWHAVRKAAPAFIIGAIFVAELFFLAAL